MAQAENFHNYVEVISDLFTLDRRNVTFFENTTFNDSIFRMFPICSVVTPDHNGQWSENFFFTEGLDFEVKMGSDELGAITHNLYWAENQLMTGETTDHVSGTNVITLVSDFVKQDEPKSKSYKENMSDVIKTILNKYNFPKDNISQSDKSKSVAFTKTNINIGETSNINYWYQANETDFTFIQRIVKNAVGVNNPTTPYFTFINSLGEFYFMGLSEMLKQKPVAKFGFSNDKYTGLDASIIQSYSIQMKGSSYNFKNYNKQVYVLQPNGTYKIEETSITDHIVKLETKDLNIRKDDIVKVRDIHIRGLSQKGHEENLKGYMNNLYRLSSFPFLFSISVYFDPKLVAGKVVELVVGSAYKETAISPEYSGKYIIIDSKHNQGSKGIAVSNLVLGRNTININKGHLYKDQFIN